jgi:DNA-binding PadR family transcriptional regulator
MDVRTLCLGVLTERPMSGYEIKKHFEQAFQHFFLAGFGSIYPALAELARDGLVSVESVEQDKRPDKKVYRITPRGWQALTEELMAARPQHRVRSEFLVLMYFAHLLPPERVGALIDEVIGRLERCLGEELEQVERATSAPGTAPLMPGQRFGLGYGRLMVSTALAYLQRQKGPLLRELEALGASDTRAAAE